MAEPQTQPSPDFRVLAFQPRIGEVRERRYHARAKHHKTTSGCVACKRRRKKCDEAKPSCSGCARSHMHCVYSRGNSTRNVQFASPYSLLGFEASSDKRGLPTSNALLHHFQHLFTDLHLNAIIDPAAILSLGMSHPYLLHAAMAVSASHIRHHTAHDSESSRKAEQLRQGEAVTSFRRALGHPTLDQQTADALVVTCMLLSLLTFSITLLQDAEKAGNNSWLFRRSDPDRLGWFSLNLGLKPLLMATEAYHGKGSILRGMYRAGDDDEGTFFGNKRSLDRVPVHWVKFLGISQEDRNYDNPSDGGHHNENDDIYREPARILAEISHLPPTPGNFVLYMNFLGGIDLDNKFRDRLAANDARAVWLLGHWMALLCRYDCWWMRGRAEMEWQAACVYLGRLKGVSDVDDETWQMVMHDLRTAGNRPSGT